MSVAALRENATIELARVATSHPVALADWEICELIHHNTHAVLYLVRNQQGEKAVIKRFGFCTQNLSSLHVKTFASTANSLGKLDLVGMVDIFQAGLKDDFLYLLMEYVEGGTLANKINDLRCYSLQQRLDWFDGVVTALASMHDKGLLHYDLKPSNIMFRNENEVVLVDCGVENQWLIKAGYQDEEEVYCSPFYVSPECAIGGTYNVQAEIYSLGIVFYELMTGEKPYRENSIIDLIKMHALAPIPSLPEEFECYQSVLEKMLAKCPEDRYTTLNQLVDDIHFMHNVGKVSDKNTLTATIAML